MQRTRSSELIFTFLHVGSSNQNASQKFCLVYPPLFCKLHSSSNPKNKNPQRYAWRFKQLYFSNHSELDNVHMNFSSQNDWDCCLQKYWYFPLKSPYTTDFILISFCFGAAADVRQQPHQNRSIQFPHHTQSSTNNSTIAAGSSNGVTSTRYCKYSCMYSWWWVEIPPKTCRAVFQE